MRTSRNRSGRGRAIGRKKSVLARANSQNALRRQRRLSGLQSRAKSQLSRFRKGSILAVAITAFLLSFTESPAQKDAEVLADNLPVDPNESVAQATQTIRDLAESFYAFFPRLAIAVAILAAGWVLTQALRVGYRKLARGSQRGANLIALVRVGIFFIVLIAALSVAVGDARALLGSLGLIGLALSWALQAPIESFTGWVLNVFRGYYQIGDRIEVGEVFGDVYKIDLLTTTVWEAGGPGKNVVAAQPTGALVTFPNSEVLRANILNYTKDFPFVWDEISFGLTNESDMRYAINLIQQKATEVIGESMARSIQAYRKLLVRQGLAYDVEEVPQVYLSLTDSWTTYTVRYLVQVRARRKWSSLLIEAISRELAREEHKGKIKSSYPRQENHVYVSKEPSHEAPNMPYG